MSNLFRLRATEIEYFIKLSLGWGATASVILNYFIPTSYESLHIEFPIKTAGYMFLVCIQIRNLKGGFSTLIHIPVQNNFICYAFEGHTNVGWGPHLALEPPVKQPCSTITCNCKSVNSSIF